MATKKPQTQMPKLGKCHSAHMAAEFVRLGWALKHEFRADDNEPYEYVFEWLKEGESVYPQPELLQHASQPTRLSSLWRLWQRWLAIAVIMIIAVIVGISRKVIGLLRPSRR